MNDKLGIPIKVGDKVAYFGKWHQNNIETVLGFTKQRVKLTDSFYKIDPSSKSHSIAVLPDKLMVITDQLEANKINYPELLL